MDQGSESANDRREWRAIVCGDAGLGGVSFHLNITNKGRWELGAQCNDEEGVNQFLLSGLTVETTWELCNVWSTWCGRNRWPLCTLWTKMIFMRK